MDIRNKAIHDPVCDMYAVDAYMRWALQAAEEVVGQKGMAIVLRQAGLERFINNYPLNDLHASGNITFGDYANLSAALLNFFGRAGKSMTIRIGRLSAQYATEQQSATFGLGTLVKASRLLPLNAQQRAGLMVMQNGLRKLAQAVGQENKLRIEDRGHALAYVDETCAMCAGKEADMPICWVFNGTLMESTRWLTGKDFEIEEVECRAMGALACVWEIKKTPKE
ncbi:MAG: 4-vinyl reductase [Chloroflexi bacterium]|nr:4-vinyl reductase [Chloroflexota bacterium]MCI0576083.1 4-vinyl reductase [Chloroflexota bacterium]MCI0647871.1 4-vinyl reductase [Chloroflexota bacterium]MCI0727122.1 4-vinyl reductase [Chloroflexota bacterium]